MGHPAQSPTDNMNKAYEGLARAIDPQDDMMKVKSMQKKFRDSFTQATLNPLKWDSVVGAGTSMNQTLGVLNMLSGTTANSVMSIISKETFTIPARLSIGLTLSQRIANQEFRVEFVSVDPVTELVDDKHICGFVFDGTTATTAKYLVKNDGLTPLISTGVTIPTTASAGLYEIEPFADEAWFHGGTLDASTSRSNSYRRHQQLPDPNLEYKVRLSWVNLATPPATTTTASVQFIAVSDYAELTAEITAGRGQSTAGQALGVNVVTMPSVTVSSMTPVAPTAYALETAATTNIVAVKASAGTVFNIQVSNTSAAVKYLKLFNRSTVPTLGTHFPQLTIPIPASSHINLDCGPVGLRFATGICIATTGAIGRADTTAVALNDLQIMISYI